MVRPPPFDAAPVGSTVSADVDRENACSVEPLQRRQRESASDLLDDHRHVEAAADDFEFFQSAAESRRAFGLEHFLQTVEMHEKTKRIDAVDQPSNVVRGILDELRKAEISISGWWDGKANMHDTPMRLTDGAVLQNCYFYVNDLTGPFWNFPWITVKGVPMLYVPHAQAPTGGVELVLRTAVEPRRIPNP